MTVSELIIQLQSFPGDMAVKLTSPEWPYEMTIEELAVWKDCLEVRGLDPR